MLNWLSVIIPTQSWICVTGPEKVKASNSAPGGITSYDDHNEDRAQAANVNAAYTEKTKPFVRWLADNGYRIRLFPGDNLHEDAMPR